MLTFGGELMGEAVEMVVDDLNAPIYVHEGYRGITGR